MFAAAVVHPVRAAGAPGGRDGPAPSREGCSVAFALFRVAPVLAAMTFSGCTTSLLVWAEAYSWFLHRHGEEAARSSRLLADNLEGLTVFEANREHHRDVMRTLDRYRGAKLTYVDGSSLCLMAQHNIKTVWATDHHLGLAGAEVLPRG
jgi:predicted nucleic acid-binding protein